MYRQYEDPRKLEEELKQAQEALERRINEEGYEPDGYDVEYIEGLRERVNFAWQDEEYDEMNAEVERW